MALSVASGTGLLVMGIGQGFATVNRLPQGPARVPPGPFLGTTEGDRVVTRLSAEKPADARFVSEWSHGELVVNFAASGSLAQALLLEDPNLRFGSELPVENLPMTLVPLTNTTLISLLNQTHRFRELFTVVGFTTQDPTKPYVFTLDRSMRRAHRFARVISGDVGGVYVFNGTAWFYVPSPKITRFFV
jgi:hypothetical protein